MAKKPTKETDLTAKTAKKQRIASLITKIKEGKALTPSEINELERYEKKCQPKQLATGKRNQKDHVTPRQEVFCQEYIIDLIATQAAIRAGYSKRTAGSQGDRLLKKVKIQQRIKNLQSERAKRTEITSDRVLEELGKIAFSNVGDFIQMKDKDGLISMEMLDNLTKEQLACVSEITEYETDRGNKRFRFKLHDKIKGLELIGKHLSMFNENINHKFQDGCGVLMVAPDMDKEKWSQRAKKQSQSKKKTQK